MPSSNDNVTQRIGDLARVLHSHESLEDSLRRVADTALEVINRCDAASVSMSKDGRVATWVSTDGAATRVDEHQYQNDEGPCLDTIRSGEPHFVDSLPSEERWPQFTPLAMTEEMVGTYSFPLAVGEETVGALNLYSRSKPFAFPDLQTAQALADQAAVTLANAQAYQQARDQVGHLEEALKSRDAAAGAKVRSPEDEA